MKKGSGLTAALIRYGERCDYQERRQPHSRWVRHT